MLRMRHGRTNRKAGPAVQSITPPGGGTTADAVATVPVSSGSAGRACAAVGAKPSRTAAVAVERMAAADLTDIVSSSKKAFLVCLHAPVRPLLPHRSRHLRSGAGPLRSRPLLLSAGTQ